MTALSSVSLAQQVREMSTQAGLRPRSIAIAPNAVPGLNAGGGDSNTADQRLPSTDTIYISNYRSNTIQMVSLTGSDLGFFAMPAAPTGLVFDSAGNLYVSSYNDRTIEKIAPDGSVSVFANTGSNPHALVFDKAGNLFLANAGSDTIEKFTTDGVRSVFADSSDGLANPLDLAFDTAGSLYVSNAYGGPTKTGSVLKFTPDGTASVFADTGFDVAYGLAFDRAGNLYVSNFRRSTIEKFSSGGTDLGVFASTGLHLPHGMIFDEAGNLYVANNGSSTIEKFSSTGNDLGVLASTGSGPHFLTMFAPRHLHFEIETLKKQASSATYTILHDSNASGGAYGILKGTVPGDFVTYTVPIVAGGTYDIKVGIQTRKDKGVFQLAIAGTNQGLPQDEYFPTLGYEVRELGTVTFAGSGNEAFEFVLTGRNPSSLGYALAFDYIDLELVP